MILDLISKYSSIVSDYKVIRYRHFATSYELVAEVLFIDNSKLIMRDYLFSDGKRKYSFHWQGSDSKCIYRWDNVPHHQGIKTFPFHKHIGETEAIEESEVMGLEKVFHFVSNHLDQ